MYHQVSFPCLCLLISGGHTLLLVARGLGDYVQLGTTLDESVGETIDKASRMLKFPYDENVGPAAAFVKAALNLGSLSQFDHSFPLPSSRRMAHSLDFSFSGLKTSLSTYLKSISLESLCKGRIAAAFMDACAAQLADRVNRAISNSNLDYDKEGEIPLIVGGGAARNEFLMNQ